MGVVMSMVQPTVGEVKKGADGKDVKKVEVKADEKKEKTPDDTSKILLGPHPDAKKKKDDESESSGFESSGGFKYLKADSPPNYGPSIGNKPSPSTAAGTPVIKPPKDTLSEAPATSSVYDTLSMAPDVDWEKKQIIASPNEQKKTT